MYGEETDLLANERDIKFKKWLQNKSLRDKALEVSFFYCKKK
jgi:hypothetical protein